jgi:hypothetical protein
METKWGRKHPVNFLRTAIARILTGLAARSAFSQMPLRPTVHPSGPFSRKAALKALGLLKRR